MIDAKLVKEKFSKYGLDDKDLDAILKVLLAMCNLGARLSKKTGGLPEHVGGVATTAIFSVINILNVCGVKELKADKPSGS